MVDPHADNQDEYLPMDMGKHAEDKSHGASGGLTPRSLKQYHVFLASPGDVSVERKYVRQFFERYNQHTAHLWNVRFEVVDWENYATIGVGRPQELINRQTLEKYRQSLALVIGIMAQRFGSRTGKVESGTEEEFNWAMESHEKHGFPEIKWFFRKIDRLEMPTDPDEAMKAVEQWKSVLAFRQRMQEHENPVFYTEYPGPAGFRDAFEHDLNLWLADPERPWVPEQPATTKVTNRALLPPSKFYESVQRAFHRLDIAGIDNDRTFEIPLSEVYVRLRVMFEEDAPEETEAYESGPIEIQTALLRYPKLVIVGDPGSGKSTFLKYIALTLARSFVTGNSRLAQEKLCLAGPLPVPIFLSCWDLADFLKKKDRANLNTLLEFVVDCLAAYDYRLSVADVETLLASGNCFLLFDGLDEVPTDAGRAAVSRLLEECVQRYGDNRFVVTSRVRAYTGDTILKGQFTRCDIQPFDAHDRAEFIRNWVALLFRVAPAKVETGGGDARKEFDALTRGIEESDRIRPLAVNPLLLTVIAIVHWNRKRLPKQRVDLYDECVDVLLGQRKAAEHIQRSRKVGALDEEQEDQTQEDRAWVRKRFAEIALYILGQDGDRDEATKADVIRLLTPRFIDRGAPNEEQAGTHAEVFLRRQELRSGLLVSRQAQSYRFVHLTFQEYLAAWQLSNMDFDKVASIIEPRLRIAKWFEVLQLLGSQWAKESDDKADRLVAWLLSKRGSTVYDQAPVVALCANIVKDISGVAELKAETRLAFKKAVEATLAAFRQGSGVPPKTQVEILEALGQLGAAVKSHLIDATRASLFQVRRRAVEMLLPHLSEDELFSLDHLFTDRSLEPIKVYLLALIDRHAARTAILLSQTKHFGEKMLWAVESIEGQLRCAIGDDSLRQLYGSFVVTPGFGFGARRWASYRMARNWPDKTTRLLLTKAASQGGNEYDGLWALTVLAGIWPNAATRRLVAARAVESEDIRARPDALEILAENWTDETTRGLLAERALEDEHFTVRSRALRVLTNRWPDETTRTLLAERAVDASLTEDQRTEHCAALGKMHSDFGRIVLTRDLDGVLPFLDPAQPIHLDHIKQAAGKARVPEDKIDETVRSLSAHMGWDITKGAPR